MSNLRGQRVASGGEGGVLKAPTSRLENAVWDKEGGIYVGQGRRHQGMGAPDLSNHLFYLAVSFIID